jgi:hypothetical protein
MSIYLDVCFPYRYQVLSIKHHLHLFWIHFDVMIGLRPYNAPNDSMECGGCKARMKKGDPFRGCKTCKEFFCAACASTPDTATEKERNPSSFFENVSQSLGGGSGSSEHKESDEPRNCSGRHGAIYTLSRMNSRIL